MVSSYTSAGQNELKVVAQIYTCFLSMPHFSHKLMFLLIHHNPCLFDLCFGRTEKKIAIILPQRPGALQQGISHAISGLFTSIVAPMTDYCYWLLYESPSTQENSLTLECWDILTLSHEHHSYSKKEKIYKDSQAECDYSPPHRSQPHALFQSLYHIITF